MSILDNLFSKVKPVSIFSRDGSPTDPYQDYTDDHVVDKNRVVLREIPHKKEKVFVTYNGQPLYETHSTQPSQNQYYVDYTLGLVIFHSSKNGLSLKFVYKGTGCVYFAADRIVIDYDQDGNPVQTLQQLVDKSKADLEADRKAVAEKIAEMNAKILETEETRLKVIADTAKAISDMETREQEVYEELRDKTDAKIAETEAARQDTITATNNANNAADHANAVADSLDHKGEYDSTLTYKERNMVDFDGATFIAMQDVPVNTPPSNITYWRMLSNKTTINSQSWVAQAGQTVFEITNGSYQIGKNKIQVIVGGVPQISGDGYVETSSTSITISGIEEGMQVFAWWFEGGISIFHSHGDTHKLGGSDELNVTDLAGYDSIDDRINDLQRVTSATEPTEHPTVVGDYIVWQTSNSAQSGGNLGWFYIEATGRWHVFGIIAE
ncbi:hypothetical protein BEH_07160 [Priestia filamentosa]|uniref:Uncharacterized protein n=1 Tax=Priestia filamentosa TaxID=1402861 RepID=A0A0H4KUC5_9BACI|nr:hypothetical protein [Priestia filamentosa]AKO91898.1 hypothetical protein BEH_07160 [Priestia filamentosa]